MNPHVGYFLAKIIGKIKRDRQKETLNKWFIKRGVHLENDGPGWININSNIAVNEPHLITIGNGTTIAGNVEFVTHDNSISKVMPNVTDLFGEIKIGRNCFVGARAVVMYGVTLADNVIVAAGSVVTKSVSESNVIVAGNPAKIIGTWDAFAEKSKDLVWNLNMISRDEMIRQTSQGIRLVRK